MSLFSAQRVVFRWQRPANYYSDLLPRLRKLVSPSSITRVIVLHCIQRFFPTTTGSRLFKVTFSATQARFNRWIFPIFPHRLVCNLAYSCCCNSLEVPLSLLSVLVRWYFSPYWKQISLAIIPYPKSLILSLVSVDTVESDEIALSRTGRAFLHYLSLARFQVGVLYQMDTFRIPEHITTWNDLILICSILYLVAFRTCRYCCLSRLGPPDHEDMEWSVAFAQPACQWIELLKLLIK